MAGLGWAVTWKDCDEVSFEFHLLERNEPAFSADVGTQNYSRTRLAGLVDLFCGTTFVS